MTSKAYQPDMLFIPVWRNEYEQYTLYSVTGRLIAYCTKKDIFGQHLAALPECWAPGTREPSFTYAFSIMDNQKWCIETLKAYGYRIVKQKLIVMT